MTKTIRSLRQARGWTQFELALHVGVQPQAVYLWESGRRTPQVPQLRRLGEVFEMCSDDIVLESISDHPRPAHRAQVNRRAGEGAPGRDRDGRVSTRHPPEVAIDGDNR
jgi:transcriptional regulator with XRE-family HTH domain